MFPLGDYFALLIVSVVFMLVVLRVVIVKDLFWVGSVCFWMLFILCLFSRLCLLLMFVCWAVDAGV